MNLEPVYLTVNSRDIFPLYRLLVKYCLASTKMAIQGACVEMNSLLTVAGINLNPHFFQHWCR